MTARFTGLFLEAEPISGAPPTPADESQTFNDDQLSFAFVTETVPMTARSEKESIAQPSIPEDVSSTSAISQSDPSDKPFAAAVESLGARLRAGREVRGLSAEDVAIQLRLPMTVVQAIEADAYERIPHQVYLRGYLQCYLRLLDLPQILAEPVLTRHAVQAPPLVTTGTISHSRYLYQRYSVPVVYLILTAVIIVPTVWLAFRGGLDQNLGRWASLDTSQPVDFKRSTSQPQSSSNDVNANIAENGAAQPLENTSEALSPNNINARDDAPLLASMAPFSSSNELPPNTAADGTSDDGISDNQTTHSVRLSLSEASWVEIIDSDGKRLEYGMLAPGSAHEFHSNKPLLIRIGNANGALLEADGKVLDLTPYRHANVAHFKLFAGNNAMPANVDY